MPVIITKPSPGGGAGAGGSDVLGWPTDGSWDDGLLDFTPTTKINDSIDGINEVLADLAPAQPDGLDGTNLVPNRSFHTGKLPTGLISDWYQDGKSAGDTITTILEYDNITLSSANPSSRFSKGDEGSLVAKHNEGGAGLATVATLDIVVNFDGTVEGPAVQDLTTWDNQGTGDPCTNAIVNFTNGKGTLEVTHCGWHNSFNAWQRMNAELVVTSMDEGYNSFVMTHDLPTDESTNESKLWYDDDTNALSFSTSPTIVENTINSNKYLSGVRYYSLNDTFDINYVGANVYRKCYHVSNVSIYRFEGQSSNIIRNPGATPAYTDSFTVNETITANRSNYYDLDTRLTSYLYHPWKSTVNASTPSENRLYCGYGNVSTAKIEYFRDENYRLVNGNYDSIPTLTGHWTSSSGLVNGQSLVYNERVQYPNHDLSSTLPTGNPDYSSGFSGNQLYLRGFYDSSAHSNVILTLNGLNVATQVGQVGSGDVNVEIKLPTQTGWLDAGKPFSSGDFTGSDGDGCQVSASGNDLSLTFGTFSTANSGGIIIVKITFRNTNRYISGMSVNW